MLSRIDLVSWIMIFLYSNCCFSMAMNRDMVPSTLDLAERAELAINGLTGTVDPDNHCEFLFGAQFCPPSVRHDAYSFAACGPKYIESWAMMRLMSGSDLNIDIQKCATDYMMSVIGDDGLFYNIIGPDRPWDKSSPEDWANVYGQARMLRAMLAMYQVDNNPVWLKRMEKLVSTLKKIAVYKDDYAYYPTTPGYGDIFSYPRSGWKNTELVTNADPNEIGKSIADLPDHSFGIPLYIGGLVEPLCRYYKLTKDQETLDLASKLVTFLLKPDSGWKPDAFPQGVVPEEHGWFYGHFHGHTLCLRGLLEYAIATNDMKLKNLVRDGYHYARTFGISRIGWFHEYTGKASHETCGLANMTALAIKLTKSGVGDYWGDVDCYARNHLTEAQFIDMTPAIKANKELTPEQLDILKRLKGAFAGWGKPDYLEHRLMNCCMANGSQALYYVWDSILEWDGKSHAKVNLLLNRSSDVIDIDSYLPYEGKVIIHNKMAKRLSVRIPSWVNKSKVTVNIGGCQTGYDWLGNYILISSIVVGKDITIEFPMKESTESYLVNSYQFRGTKFLGQTKYTIKFRGNTAIDIQPRTPNIIYKTYDRKYVSNGNTPMKKAKRWSSGKRIDW